MQTFLPYADFERSLECLDSKRLGKQRVEAYQILRVLQGQSSGWRNHPAVKMWDGYEPALTLYMNCAIVTWRRRGFRNTMEILRPTGRATTPEWFGDEAFHRSHQSNLIRKLPEHYRPIFGNEVPDDLPYVWPVRARVGRPAR